jgi:hypothetical protein
LSGNLHSQKREPGRLSFYYGSLNARLHRLSDSKP